MCVSRGCGVLKLTKKSATFFPQSGNTRARAILTLAERGTRTRTARRLLLRKCTRRLARIGTAAELAEGIDGVDDSVNVQIEFGVDGASTPNVDALLALLATPPVGSTCSQTGCDPMRALYPRRIKLNTNAELTTLANTQRLAFFRNSRSKQVALVSWGGRTCVLFKHKSDETTSLKHEGTRMPVTGSSYASGLKRIRWMIAN